MLRVVHCPENCNLPRQDSKCLGASIGGMPAWPVTQLHEYPCAHTRNAEGVYLSPGLSGRPSTRNKHRQNQKIAPDMKRWCVQMPGALHPRRAQSRGQRGREVRGHQGTRCDRLHGRPKAASTPLSANPHQGTGRPGGIGDGAGTPRPNPPQIASWLFAMQKRIVQA